MGVVLLHFLSLVLKICAFACSLPIHGSAVPLVGEGSHALPSGPGLQPPLEMPTDRPSFTWTSPSRAPENIIVSPPAPVWGLVPIGPNVPPFIIRAPAPSTMPSSRPPPNEQTRAPSSFHSHHAKAPVLNVPISPVTNAPAPRRMPESQPPSLPPELPKNPSPVKPIVNESPSNAPEQNVSPILASPPRIDKTTTATIPVSAPSNKRGRHYAPESYVPTKGPTASSPVGPSNWFRSSRNHRHPRVYNSTPAPEPYVIPPPSPVHLKPPSPDSKYGPMQAPTSPHQTIFPYISPKASPSGPSPRTPKMPHLPPRLSLPPPPPQKGCGSMICTEPYTYGPPESPCGCVLPIQVGLRLTMALYSFFPLVSELAFEIANGVFMKQSQVRIMGANETEDYPDKTVVLIDLLPLGQKFDTNTAYITFQRFWRKEVTVETELFGEYDVLYVKYPGLPPSPPSPPSTDAVIASKPYLGHLGPKPVQPLGVDVSEKQQKRRLGGSILAMVVLSCFVAVFLLCAVAWVFVFRYRLRVLLPDPPPPAIVPSQVKSSGLTMSMVGSGTTTSPTFSLGSSMAAYTGSAKTFTSHDIKRVTDFFNESRIIGEGGFGLVYSGVLDDGTKVAVKILKRYDQQGGREFLAEVEMLSWLHHRNLVKLIGICVEDPTRCLVYELIPNGSVESHLHGCDKERSPLDWRARLTIALGAARALAYLHEDSSPRVIHRDFKASNILLEDDFTPKVSDFGLACTALDEENRHISTRVMGTFGYVAPEYAMTGHLLVKSDVYSYGVVLLELLTGRKPVDMSQPPGEENLVSWARPLLTRPEGLQLIADQAILGTDPSPLDDISKVAAIASMCVQPDVSNRPFMGEVVQALKLVYNEFDENREFLSGNSSPDDFSTCEEVWASAGSDRARLPGPLLSPPLTYSDYDYRMDVVERDLSMSGLLSPSARFGPQESECFRRHSSSGPLRTARAKPVWRTMRMFSRGSVSEHGARFRLWPGSH